MVFASVSYRLQAGKWKVSRLRVGVHHPAGGGCILQPAARSPGVRASLPAGHAGHAAETYRTVGHRIGQEPADTVA